MGRFQPLGLNRLNRISRWPAMNRSPDIFQESDRRVMKNEMLGCGRRAINSTPGIEIRSVMEPKRDA